MKMFLLWSVSTFLVLFSPSCSQVRFQSADDTGAKSCTGAGCTAYTYNWFQGGYGTCSKSCGGGIQTQTVSCQRSDGTDVGDSYCSGTKPNSSRTCNAQSCTGGSSYSWVPSSWSACSKTCGGGTQIRSVNCQRDDGVYVGDSYCSGTKPGTSQTCNTQSCTSSYTYNWMTGSWSACSKTCGGGSATRSVTCVRNDGATVNQSYCSTSTEPSATMVCNTQSCSGGVNKTKTVSLPQPALDVIMIFDDSYSMGPDNVKLAQRMAGFLSDLDAANVDYHVCLTTTDSGYYKGSPIKWGHYSGSTWVSSGSVIINKSTPNKGQLFDDTIKYIGAEWSSDERAIASTYLMVRDFTNSGCFRAKASLAAIVISDENERSVGGNYSWSSAQYEPLEAMDYGDNLIAMVASKFNTSSYTKPFIWNSIIVKPGDTACEATQDGQGSPSFFGTMYADLSNKTGGHVGSICDSDYTQNLRYIRDRVIQTMPSVTLDCNPIATPTVTINPSFSTHISVSGNVVQFNPALPEGSVVTVDYTCPN